MCPEDNKQVVVVNRIAGVLKSRTSSCMPACGQRVRIVFYDVVEVPIMAVAWAYGIGYLQITGFNPITQEVELENLCPSNCPGQAAPGTPIPACTLFAIQAPLCSQQSGQSGTSLFPYLNSGFTAPAASACIDITLTNVNGLSVNRNVSINNGIYRLSAIKSATLVTICNDGSGLAPGTVVNYEDAAGNLIVPIVLIDSNPCLNSAVPAGKLLVCHSNVTQPLSGSLDNQVPVLNLSTGEVDFRTLGIPTLDCSTLTVCLTLDPALPPGTAYLVQVVSTASFTVTELVTIGGTQFTVQSIPDATHIYLVPVVTPGAIETFPVGATLCSANCCEVLSAEIDAIVGSANFADAAPFTPALITSGQTASGSTATLTLTNTSTTNTMGIHVAFSWTFVVTAEGLDTEGADVDAIAELAFGPDPVGGLVAIYNLPDTITMKSVTGGPANQNRKSYQASFNGTFVLSHGQSGTINARASFIYNFGNLTTGIQVEALDVRMSYLGVAIA